MTLKDLQDSLDAIRMKLTAAIDEGRSVFLLLEHAQILPGQDSKSSYIQDALAHEAQLLMLLEKTRKEVTALKRASRELQ